MDSRVRFNLALPDVIDENEPAVTSGYDGDNEKEPSRVIHPQESKQDSKNKPNEDAGKPPKHQAYNSQAPLTMLLNAPHIGGQFRFNPLSISAPASAVYVSQSTGSTNYITPAVTHTHAPATKRRR
jgi:hypothetical protein